MMDNGHYPSIPCVPNLQSPKSNLYICSGTLCSHRTNRKTQTHTAQPAAPGPLPKPVTSCH